MISIKQAYIFALEIFKKRWKLFLALCVVLFATSALSKVSESFALVTQNRIILAVVGVIFLALYVILNAFFNAGVKNILLSLVHGRIARFHDIIASLNDAKKYLLGQLIVLFFVFIGILLGIIIISTLLAFGAPSVLPAICIIILIGLFLWVASRFGFWGYAIFDKNSTPRQAFSYSKKITHGHSMKIISFFLLSGLIAGVVIIALSLIPIPVVVFILILIVGYISTSLFLLSSVHIYHQLDALNSALPTATDLREEHVVIRSEELEAPEPKRV